MQWAYVCKKKIFSSQLVPRQFAVNDPHRALNVDLDAPLDEADMMLPVAKHHVVKFVVCSFFILWQVATHAVVRHSRSTPSAADKAGQKAAKKDKKHKEKEAVDGKKEKKDKKDKKEKTDKPKDSKSVLFGWKVALLKVALVNYSVFIHFFVKK